MGWGVMPDLSDDSVMCQAPCGHESCRAWRRTKTTCDLCGEAVEAGDKFYFADEDPDQCWHARCVWSQAEEARGDP